MSVVNAHIQGSVFHAEGLESLTTVRDAGETMREHGPTVPAMPASKSPRHGAGELCAGSEQQTGRTSQRDHAQPISEKGPAVNLGFGTLTLKICASSLL